MMKNLIAVITVMCACACTKQLVVVANCPGCAVTGLTMSLSSIDFGSVQVGSAPVVQNVKVTNGGVAPVRASLSATPAAVISIVAPTSGTACANSNNTIAVNANSSCSFGVQLNPLYMDALKGGAQIQSYESNLITPASITVTIGSTTTVLSVSASMRQPQLVSSPMLGYPDDITVGIPKVSMFKLNASGSPSVSTSFYPISSSWAFGTSVGSIDLFNLGISELVVGSGPGGPPEVKIFKTLPNGALPLQVADFLAWTSASSRGVYVTSCDFNHDGFPDIIVSTRTRMTSADPTPSSVFVFSGNPSDITASGPKLLTEFQPYSNVAGFNGAVRVACGNLLGNGTSMIVTAPGPDYPDSGIVEKVAFNPTNGTTGTATGASTSTNTLYETDPDFLGGQSISGVGPIFGAYIDATSGVMVAQVNIYEWDASSQSAKPYSASPSFEPFPSYAKGPGVYVAVGDVNGDGVDEIIVSKGSTYPGTPPEVEIFQLGNATPLVSWSACVPAFGGAVSVATGDFTGSGKANIITSAGAGGGPETIVWVYGGPGVTPTKMSDFMSDFYLYSNGTAGKFGGGTFVGFLH